MQLQMLLRIGLVAPGQVLKTVTPCECYRRLPPGGCAPLMPLVSILKWKRSLNSIHIGLILGIVNCPHSHATGTTRGRRSPSSTSRRSGKGSSGWPWRDDMPGLWLGTPASTSSSRRGARCGAHGTSSMSRLCYRSGTARASPSARWCM